MLEFFVCFGGVIVLIGIVNLIMYLLDKKHPEQKPEPKVEKTRLTADELHELIIEQQEE